MLKRIFSVLVVFCMAMSIMSGFAEEININVMCFFRKHARQARIRNMKKQMNCFDAL